LRHAQGRPDDALSAYREALAVIEGVAAHLQDMTLRDIFVTSPHVKLIRASNAASDGH
jgi:hypothetical protein